jgi:hypothetical protein
MNYHAISLSGQENHKKQLGEQPVLDTDSNPVTLNKGQPRYPRAKQLNICSGVDLNQFHPPPALTEYLSNILLNSIRPSSPRSSKWMPFMRADPQYSTRSSTLREQRLPSVFEDIIKNILI